MKTIATPAAIAAGVEEASNDAVAGCFVSIKSWALLLHQRRSSAAQAWRAADICPKKPIK